MVNPHGDPPMVRAGPSRMLSFVRFINRTQRTVDVIWINYDGHAVRYKTLTPMQYVDVNTFVGHPWIFRDSLTGDKLYVKLKDQYDPIGWNPQAGPPQRRRVYIYIPVYTLQERCLQVLRRLVPKNYVPSLEIPETLKTELLNGFTQGVSIAGVYNPAENNIDPAYMNNAGHIQPQNNAQNNNAGHVNVEQGGGQQGNHAENVPLGGGQQGNHAENVPLGGGQQGNHAENVPLGGGQHGKNS